MLIDSIFITQDNYLSIVIFRIEMASDRNVLLTFW